MACKYHSCLPSLPRHSLHQKHDIDTAIPWFHAPAASSAPHGAARCPSAATARAAATPRFASSSSSWFRMSWGSNICHHPWDENEWISHGIWSWAPRIACWSQRIYIYMLFRLLQLVFFDNKAPLKSNEYDNGPIFSKILSKWQFWGIASFQTYTFPLNNVCFGVKSLRWPFPDWDLGN